MVGGAQDECMTGSGLSAEVIRALRALAERHGLASLVLFGSRARGDYREKSDIDLAVLGGDFGRFALDVRDEVPTLLAFDFVNLDERVSEKLRNAIEREGRVLYEKVS